MSYPISRERQTIPATRSVKINTFQFFSKLVAMYCLQEEYYGLSDDFTQFDVNNLD